MVTQQSTHPSQVAKTKPLTGEEYLESLRDGREIWIYGERVKDVTQHPGFRNVSRMLARLYDSLHDVSHGTKIVAPTDAEETSGYTHKFFLTPRSVDDLVGAKDAIAEWARMTYGWLGRSPDYKASFLGTLGVNTEFYAPYQDNARRWYAEAQEKVLYFNHAIVNPPVDRHKSMDEVTDVYMHVEEETDAGLIVSGAKVVATGSALTHYNFIANYAPVPPGAKNLAAIFIVPTGARGVKLICRPSFEYRAGVGGSPFDYPLSSRLDENDAIFVFDRVLVPWENVFAYDVETSNNFFVGSGFVWRAMLHGCVRLAVKLDFLAGLLIKGLEVTGAINFRGVQTRVGEVLNYRNLFWGLADAMVRNPIPWVGGAVQVNPDAAVAYRGMMGPVYNRVKEIFFQDLGSALVYVPSHAKDWSVPEVRECLEKYVRGSDDFTAEYRAKLMKLIWDAVGSEFGGRHELYEINYSGNHEDTKLQTLWGAQATGQVDLYKAMVERCMAEYDTNGWTVPDLINPQPLLPAG